MVSLRALIIACLVTALVGAGGGMLGATLIAPSTGLTGTHGPAGTAGADGVDGAGGPAGEPGQPGTDGAPGAAGAPGPAGPAGPRGPAGESGAPGEVGPEGPAGPQGAPGVAEFASFRIGAHGVLPVVPLAAPLVWQGGELDAVTSVTQNGGTEVAVPEGVYRISAAVTYLAPTITLSGVLQLSTDDQRTEMDSANPSSVMLDPTPTDELRWVSTTNVVLVDDTNSPITVLTQNRDFRDLQLVTGWLLVERLGDLPT